MTPVRMETPPRWATWLLTTFSHPDTQEEVEGDMLELYAHWYQTLGQRRANWRYGLNALRLLRLRARFRTHADSSHSLLRPAMIRNYLTVARRQLWRNRVFTLLNVVGLSIGLCTSWIIYRIVSYELAFDQHIPDKERIYRVVIHFKPGSFMPTSPGLPVPLLAAIPEQVPGIEHAVPIRTQWSESVYVPQVSGKPERFRAIDLLVATNPDYFERIPYHWLAGHQRRALEGPNQVVLTQDRAARYFPHLTAEQVLGRRLIYFDTLSVQVVGVVANPTRPSSLGAQEFLSLATVSARDPNRDQWDNINSADQLFVWLSPQTNPARLAEQINRLAAVHSSGVRLKNGQRERWHLLQPLADVHFDTEYADSSHHVDKEVLYKLMGLAAFILLLAIINYINLTTALTPGRAREIGIRRTLGSRSGAIIGQFLGETVLVTLLALGVSFVLAPLFFTQFGDWVPAGAEQYLDWSSASLFVIGLLVSVSLLAGLYPGWLATRSQTVGTLKGAPLETVHPLLRGLTLRKGLIVFQFGLAQVFIVCAWLLGQQLRYALHKDMGFERQAVVVALLPINNQTPPEQLGKRMALRQAINQLPGVALVSLGSLPANQSVSRSELSLPGDSGEVTLGVQFKFVDSNYIHLYKLPILAGRNLQPTDTMRDFVLNETAVRRLGFKRPQDAIGKQLSTGTVSYPIVGVVRDFQTNSVRHAIEPLALISYQHHASYISIRLAAGQPDNWVATLANIGNLWRRFYPDEPFNSLFYDESVQAFYEQERALSRIINLATGIAVLISCLGLFGLAMLTSQQRTREIGVRKVLGASVSSILLLLSSEFIKLVLLATLLGSPIAWYLMEQWLADFAYKIDVDWWVFILTGLLALLVALLTVSYQSLRAALANPVNSLRNE